MMEESRYLQLVDRAFRTLQDAFEDTDPDKVDVYMAGDVLTLALANGVKCVVNTQRPTRQIWVAAKASAWHLDYDSATGRWIDDKGRGDELFSLIETIVRTEAGISVKIKRPPPA